MQISAPKSTVTLFTPWTKQVNKQLDVKIDGVAVPTVKSPRLLGVIFDPMFTFSHHSASIARRASSRLNILRALSDTSFGKDRECLVLTFKMFIRTLFDYCAPIVYPIYSPASVERLQRVQNKALRLATGCHTAAAVDHLHTETGVLPVSDHLHLLSSQFLARALHPDHVSHPYALLDQGRRGLKQTLRSKCIADVQPYLEEDGSLGRGQFSLVKNKLHTDIVDKSIRNRAPNRVLGVLPPPIDASEASLPRITRTSLSQLRSGHCARLKDYQLRIGKMNDNLCADCDLFPQTVNHLFDCPAHPTTLGPEDLWGNPRDVVDHLRNFQSFDFLPALGSPPRLHPRRRPPAAPPDSPVFSPLTLPPSPFFSLPRPGPPPVPPLMNFARLSPVSSRSRSLHSSISSRSLSISSSTSSVGSRSSLRGVNP